MFRNNNMSYNSIILNALLICTKDILHLQGQENWLKNMWTTLSLLGKKCSDKLSIHLKSMIHKKLSNKKRKYNFPPMLLMRVINSGLVYQLILLYKFAYTILILSFTFRTSLSAKCKAFVQTLYLTQYKFLIQDNQGKKNS